ncbi:hypothetical protein [Rhodopirellula baltica]|jgi:hypothetical protein|uniref:Uncharacterized protein n=2 Tax=Rhodopirellula baltica TaxID=265606 RepID=F2B0J1_RHOBT|nr:hypothetical protein [Rhodopirellula baltica]EGF24544.1 hypothetical protein RBWH47_00091 [Rhodopirellula baltica WH47]EKK03588.1 hypothetical protein RBSH_01037 [Rhodopirellula baltica SH28]
MATTLATKKQSAAIKQRMAEIRTELPYEVDDARVRVRQLTDWKYHMSRHPLPILAGVAALGFLIVPNKRTPERIIIRETPSGTESTPAPAKKGLMAGIAGTVMTLALRQASTVAAQQINRILTNRTST